MLNSPDFTINTLSRQYKELARLTQAYKSTKSDEDLQNLLKHKWNLSMRYRNGVGPFVPIATINSVLADCGKSRRLGKQMGALQIEGSAFPILPKKGYQFKDQVPTREELWSYGESVSDDWDAGTEFVDIRPVGIQKMMVLACRPKFPKWEITFEALFEESRKLTLQVLEDCLREGGMSRGMGSGRSIGMGRFSSEITVLSKIS